MDPNEVRDEIRGILHKMSLGRVDALVALVGRAVEAARAEQREADAKKVETMFPPTDGPGWLMQDARRDLANHIAAAIRSALQETADE